MIISHVDEIAGGPADVQGDGWRSLRFGLSGDGLGYTMTETTVAAGTDHVLWYKHHIEACYCIEGTGEIIELETGRRHAIRPGAFYALDRHDRHRFIAIDRMRLICVFRPALAGKETHDGDGTYPV